MLLPYFSLGRGRRTAGVIASKTASNEISKTFFAQMRTHTKNLTKMMMVNGDDGDKVTFEDAFGPLAHHLFPDGCLENTEGPDLSCIWPSRTDRTAVPAKEAQAAISQLRRVSADGLTQNQMWAVTIVACETLPKTVADGGAGSPLVDGTSKCFCALVRCLLPLKCQNDDGNSGIPSAVVMRLVAARCDSLGRIVVLRFLTLAIRSGALLGDARQTLSGLYGTVFAWVADPDTCMDAVRLLHAITRRKHVRVYRAQRLNDWYTGGGDVNMSSIWLLLQLFARYDPEGCGKYFPSSNQNATGSSAWSRYFKGKYLPRIAVFDWSIPSMRDFVDSFSARF